MGQSADDSGAQVAELAAALLSRAGELAATMVDRIYAGVPAYRAGVVSREVLLRTCLDNVHFILGPLGRTPALTSPESRENGRARARAGVPLIAIMEAYRVGARYLWEELAETAMRQQVPTQVSLRAASEMWLVLDTYTHEMAEGYREEVTATLVGQEQARAAMLDALLEGLPGGWEAADELKLPVKGDYVVVTATAAEPGRHALPRVEQTLRAVRISSAWRLHPGDETGIVALPAGRSLSRVHDILADCGEGPVGLSSVYDDLTATAHAYRLARIALRGSIPGSSRVVAFGQSTLANAAAAAPEVMRQLAGITLGGLSRLPAGDRQTLLSTFGAWLGNGGSADRTGKVLFCHPNTVRHRLRRLETLTGLTLADPRQCAELALAYEIDRF
jgi:hypothetical protein